MLHTIISHFKLRSSKKINLLVLRTCESCCGIHCEHCNNHAEKVVNEIMSVVLNLYNKLTFQLVCGIIRKLRFQLLRCDDKNGE